MKLERLFLAILVAALAACGDDDATPDGGAGLDGGDGTIGSTTVELDGSKKLLRSREALLGNLVADAYLEQARAIDPETVLALVNGGDLRCPAELDASGCEGYVIEAGPITQADLEVFLQFNTALVVKTLTGAQIRSTLERSVSSLPTGAKGWFLHPSTGASYSADCALVAQEVTADAPPQLAAEGARVTDVTLGGTALVDNATYKVVVNSYVGSGDDGHVLLGAAPQTDLQKFEQEAMRLYLSHHSPVTPEIEGRIVLTSACDMP